MESLCSFPAHGKQKTGVLGGFCDDSLKISCSQFSAQEVSIAGAGGTAGVDGFPGSSSGENMGKVSLSVAVLVWGCEAKSA